MILIIYNVVNNKKLLDLKIQLKNICNMTFSFLCVIGDGQYGILVIIKDVHAIFTLRNNLGKDMEVIVRYFQMKTGVLSTDKTSHVEVDDEVFPTVKCKHFQYLFKRIYMFIYII